MPASFPDRLRLPLDFEPERLAADMANFSQIQWIEHFVTQNYDGDWSVIPLRGPAGARHLVQMIYSDPSRSDFEDTPMLAGSRYFQEVLAAFACPLQAVRLMRLTPGSTIKEHRDHDLSFEQGMVRIHIPVVTNDGVDFRLNGVRCVMPAGSSWYLRLSDPHSVANRGRPTGSTWSSTPWSMTGSGPCSSGRPGARSRKFRFDGPPSTR
jgi:hypothetical protein